MNIFLLIQKEGLANLAQQVPDMLPVAVLNILTGQETKIKQLREKVDLLKDMVLELVDIHKDDEGMDAAINAFKDIYKNIETDSIKENEVEI